MRSSPLPAEHLALSLALLAAPAARADTTVWGIPAECQLAVVECDTGPDPAKRLPPRVLSSVFMERAWTTRGYEPSPDGSTLLVHLEDGLRLVRGHRKDDYALDLAPEVRQVAWHSDSKRVAVWLKDAGAQALAVLDTSRLPPGPRREGHVPYEVVHRVPPGEEGQGFEWSPDGQALVVRGSSRDAEGDQRYGTLTRVSLDPELRTRELLRVPGALDLLRGSSGSFDRGGLLLYGHTKQLFVIADRPIHMNR